MLFFCENNDSTINIWDFKNSNNNKILKGDNRKIFKVLRLNNNEFLSLSEDGNLRIWNLENNLKNRLLKRISSPPYNIIKCENDYIVTISINSLILWKLEQTKNIIFIDEFHTVFSKIDRVLKLKNGKFLIVLKNNKSKLKIFDFWDKNYHAEFKSEEPFYRVIELENGSILYHNGTYGIWDYNSTERSRIIGKCIDIQIPREIGNNKLVISEDRGLLKIIDLKNDKNDKIFYAHNDYLENLFKISKDEILTFASDNTLKIWNFDNTKINNIKGNHSILSYQLLLNSKVISFFNDSTLKVLDLENLHNNKILEVNNSEIYGAIELKNKKILSWSKDKILNILDLENPHNNKILKVNNSKIYGVIELENKKILSWSKDKILRIWDLENLCHKKSLIGHSKEITLVIELKDKRILSMADDDTVRVWDLNNEKKNRIFKVDTNRFRELLELKNGRVVLFSGVSSGCINEEDRTIIIWDIENDYSIELTLHSTSIIGVLGISHRKIVSWSYDNLIIVWDLYNLLNHKLKGHINQIINVIELGEGKLLSYCSNSIKIWDLENINKNNVPTIYIEQIREIIKLNKERILVITEKQFYVVNTNLDLMLKTTINLPVNYQYYEIITKIFNTNNISISRGNQFKTYSLQKGNRKVFFSEIFDHI